MANQFDDEDEFDGGNDNDSALVKDLRKQLRTAKQETASLAERLEGQSKSLRDRAVKDVLTGKGVRPNVAKYIPKDLVSEEEITAWLEENADDFGIDMSGGQRGEDDAAREQDTHDANRARSLQERSVPSSKMADFEARMAVAETPQEINQIMQEAAAASL